MKLPLSRFALPLLAVVALLLMVAWMSGAFTEKMPPGTVSAQSYDGAGAIAVQQRVQQVYESVPASIEAKQATTISSRILARIEKIHVRAGDEVSAGQLLVELEESDLQSRVAQTRARIESVNARLKEARQSLSRATDLAHRGLLAQSDLDRARANHDALAAELASARQALNEAEAILGFAEVRAPIGGRIVDRFAEPGDTARPGVQLLSLYNPLSLRVEANVREQLAVKLKVDQPIRVTVPALDRTLESQIEELVPAGNAGSRSFLVKSRLQQFEGLLPGMYARLRIPAGTQSLLLIPRDRVASVSQLDIVWVIDSGAVERRFVRLGEQFQDGMVEVVSGLHEGDLVLPVPTPTPTPSG